MKISYRWLKEFIDTTKTPEEISQILTNIGLEVESLEQVQAVAGGLEGLVIGYVKDCIQHPNADRLRVTTVNIGTGTDLQIVCGAPNVAAGQKVVVALIGSTVYPTVGEPFKINKSKIRGEVSEGMICAEDEIGLGDDHAGIIVLNDDAVIGVMAKDYYSQKEGAKIQDDYVFEIGLTPNRADAASHLGVARDLAAYERSVIKMPDVSGIITDNHDLPIPIIVEDEQACLRYSGLTISMVTVKESPDWLKDKLNVIGVRPVNNVVDVTNYVLHELGQPLHAFDADEITGGKVLIKKAKKDDLFITLDDIERKLSADDLMICNAQEPMCIAGVFGGTKSGVKLTTTKIFLESACFNSVSIRKTSKRHGLKTDASFRFERGTDPEMTVTALKRAALLIKEVAGGQISSEIYDFYPSPVNPFNVTISYSNVNRLIGKHIPVEEIKSILQGLNIQITGETEEGLILKVPAYKVDVTREVDIIEEILRMYGYNNIEIPAQVKASLNYAAKPDKEQVQNIVAELLTANGFNEILSNSLTSLKYSDNPEEAVRILNPLSSDLDVMRGSLLFSGLEAIAYNQNRRSPNLKFYEFGKTYRLNKEEFLESSRLSVFLTGSKQAEQWNSPLKPVNFYDLKSTVDAITKRLNLKEFNTEDCSSSNLLFGLKYKKGERTLVEFGKVAPSALKKTDLTGDIFYADLDWDLLLKAVRNNKITYQEVSRFPSVRRDLSMLLNTGVTFGQLKQIAERSERKLLKEVNVFDVYQGDKLAQGKKSYALSFILQDDEKTLADKQIDAIMQKLIVNFEKEAGAEIRK
ncbi:MAG TPA: phenylalanine--tRNA ligase subunit beta [Sphingobacteriaceae bacterium]|nr:phenylalanine--tRNA ligase subunit beta [Sphingobacteriaceae bacterium]